MGGRRREIGREQEANREEIGREWEGYSKGIGRDEGRNRKRVLKT